MSSQHIDNKLNNRNDSQQSSQSPAPKRGTWSPEEDRRLLHLVDQSKVIKWVEIAEHLGTRTSKQCRERYHQKLKPSLSHEPISAAESEQIERLVALYGKRWALIARHLKGRSDNVIKNWWNASLNRRRLTSVHLTPVPSHGLQQTESSYNNSPSSSLAYSQPSSAGSVDALAFQDRTFAANVLNSRFGTSNAGTAPNESNNDSMPSPRSQSSYEANSRSHLLAPPTIGVEFNPRYADIGANKNAGSSFGSDSPVGQTSRAYSSSGLESTGSFNPFPDSDLRRSRVWSEFGLYSDELAKTTPSSVEALSLNRYSLGDPNFGVNYERRKTVCPSQLPSLFSSASSQVPSESESRSTSDVSSSAPTDCNSELSSGTRSERGYRSSGDSASPSKYTTMQRDSKIGQFNDFPGRFGQSESGQHSIEDNSGGLGGPPGGLPGLNGFGAKRSDNHVKSPQRSHLSPHPLSGNGIAFDRDGNA